MTNNEGRLPFEASANLQRLIGRELVPNEEVALTELVKNAYDSGANSVIITIQPPSKKEPGHIEVRDDGHGMTLDDLRRVFMVAGYSERPEQVNTAKRIPTGEKGIGRFAADRLGKNLSVLTKSKGEKHGIELDIDWEAFKNKRKTFHDITAAYKLGPTRDLGEKITGTVLSISGLRSEWPPVKIESVRRSLAGLLNPYHQPPDFQINLDTPSSPRLSGPINQDRPAHADIEIDVRVLKNGQIRRRSNDPTNKEEAKSETLAPTTESSSLAGLTAHFLYYEKPPAKTATKGLVPAVRLFRDGVRVEPFASPTSDWLGLSEKRAKRAGHAHIVPSRLFGFVEISRRTHPDLGDTTSRQALLDEQAARGLVRFLKGQLDFLEEKIRTEITVPRWEKQRQIKTKKLLEARYQTVSFLSMGLAHELRQPLQSIQVAAENISSHLAAASLQIPQIDEASAVIQRGVERIEKHITFLKNIGSGNEDTERLQLDDIVNQITEEFKEQASAKNIKLRVRNSSRPAATFNRSAILITLTNLIMNAVQAIEETDTVQPHQITLALNEKRETVKIIIEDDGPGIPEEVRSRLFRRTTTTKQGGVGVALLLCRDLLQMFDGDLQCTSYSQPTRFDIIIPKD